MRGAISLSLGLLLYKMATGRQAVSGRTTALVFDAILHHVPTPPLHLNPYVPLDLERIIMRAIEKDRRVRYQTASDLAADLRRAKRQVESGAVATAELRPRTDAIPRAEVPDAAVHPASTVGTVVATGPRKVSPLAWVAAAALSVAVIAGLFYQFRGDDDVAGGIGASGRPAVAVAAFENPGGNDETRWRLEQLERALVPRRSWETWYAQTLEGEIAFARGDLAGAEQAFADAEPPLKMNFNMGGPSATLVRNSHPFRDGAARVSLVRGDIDGAIDVYRRLLALDLSQKWTAIVEPRLVLQLARVLNKKGDRTAARQEYQRFLDLWKRADPELPELAEARAALATR